MNHQDGLSIKEIHDLIAASRSEEVDLTDLQRELRGRYEKLYAAPLDLLYAGSAPPISPADWQTLRNKLKALDLRTTIAHTGPNPTTQPTGI